MRKRRLRYTTTILVLILMGAGFSTVSLRVYANEEAEASAAPPIGDQQLVAQVCDSIQDGDFRKAKGLLAPQHDAASPALQRLNEIVAEYEQIEARREQQRIKAYEERHAKYEELTAAPVPEDPNAIDEHFGVVVRLHEYATEEQREELTSRPFVKELVRNALAAAEAFEKRGEWGKAYSYAYYWLQLLDEDNAEYREHAELLIEKASIKGSLRDNPCEKAIEKYQGIRPDMFLRAVAALDFKYVSPVNYRAMVDKALQRCTLLGEVLSGETEDLAVQVGPARAQLWQLGIETIRKQIDSSPAQVTRDIFVSMFDEILTLNRVTLELDEEVVVAHFAEAALSALDPYTSLVWPDQIREFQKSITQRFTGIGIRMIKQGKSLKVVSLIPDTPAYASGLDAGDLIVAVDGEPTEEMTSDCAVRRISGPKGTPVTLTVRHADAEEVEEITIVRDTINVPTIYGSKRDEGAATSDKWDHMIDPENKIAYIRLSSFVEDTADSLDELLEELESQGLAALVLDLRANSGGLLVSAVEIVDLFVRKGLILRSQPRRMVPNFWSAQDAGTHPDYPVAVLIDGSSASASEIVAGALQDPAHRRAIIVGSRSFGKGSVQEITDFTGFGSQFKFTTAYYHLPSGQPVANRYILEREGRTDWGITPDVEVELRSNERGEVFRLQRAGEIVENPDRNPEDDAKETRTLADTIQADPQLATALLVLKSRLIQNGSTEEFRLARTEATAAKPEAVGAH